MSPGCGCLLCIWEFEKTPPNASKKFSTNTIYTDKKANKKGTHFIWKSHPVQLETKQNKNSDYFNESKCLWHQLGRRCLFVFLVFSFSGDLEQLLHSFLSTSGGWNVAKDNVSCSGHIHTKHHKATSAARIHTKSMYTHDVTSSDARKLNKLTFLGDIAQHLNWDPVMIEVWCKHTMKEGGRVSGEIWESVAEWWGGPWNHNTQLKKEGRQVSIQLVSPLVSEFLHDRNENVCWCPSGWLPVAICRFKLDFI